MGDVSLDRPIKAEPVSGGIAQDNRTANLMLADWTDERHTLYISSMESSFLDQLYKRGRDANQNDSSASGFKVLKGGVWEKLKLKSGVNAVAPVSAKCCLPANPSNRRFRPRDCSSSASGNGAETSVGDHESGIQTIPGRTPLSHERELGACKGEKLLDENTEVSDQNFADDEAEVDAESSIACKRKRLSGTSAYCAAMIKSNLT